MIAANSAIREHDVLMGRGTLPSRHPGNIGFRALIEARFPEYISGDDRGYARQQLFGEIVDLVGQAGGRFLKKVDGCWLEVDKVTARCKVGQQFRDGTKLRRKSRRLLRGCEFALDFVNDNKARTYAEMVKAVSERLHQELRCGQSQGPETETRHPQSRQAFEHKLILPFSNSNELATMGPEISTCEVQPIPLNASHNPPGEDDTVVLRILARAHTMVSGKANATELVRKGSTMAREGGDADNMPIDSLETWSEIVELLDD